MGTGLVWYYLLRQSLLIFPQIIPHNWEVCFFFFTLSRCSHIFLLISLIKCETLFVALFFIHPCLWWWNFMLFGLLKIMTCVCECVRSSKAVNFRKTRYNFNIFEKSKQLCRTYGKLGRRLRRDEFWGLGYVKSAMTQWCTVVKMA